MKRRYEYPYAIWGMAVVGGWIAVVVAAFSIGVGLSILIGGPAATGTGVLVGYSIGSAWVLAGVPLLNRRRDRWVAKGGAS